MNRYSLTHVSDPVLLRELRALVAQDRVTTATLLAHLAEVDARRLYAPAGYPSMFAWCVEELRFSEDATCKRIRAARVAREFPAVFTMLADGRLHLSAVVLLAPHLTPQNAEDLFTAATHQSRAGIEQLLAERFPRPDLPDRIEGLARSPGLDLSAPGRMKFTDTQLTPERVGTADLQLAPGRVGFADAQLSPGTVGSPGRPGVAPLAPGRYGLQFTVGQATYEKLRHAQALLGHAVPSGDLADVLERALDALIARLEQRKCATAMRPRQYQRRASACKRHVPAEVRRSVWERDGGRCTFVSAAGHRCEARTRLEFDHVEPVAREGRTTVTNLRLRCRAHNQWAADRAFGADFMSRKREAAQRASAAVRQRAATADRTRTLAAAAAEEAHTAALAEQARVRAAAAEVVPWLRRLGLRVDEARRAAEHCENIPDAPLAERVGHAFACHGGPGQKRAAPIPRPVASASRAIVRTASPAEVPG